MESEPKKTPLYDEHIALGGKMADFAGWLMPLWYPTGQVKEHFATRQACGLFDICHMGEFSITGKGSLQFLSRMLTNNIERMTDGQAMYNFMLNEAGGAVDDCILYRFDDSRWMLVVNGGTIEGDFTWLKAHAPGDVSLEDISGRTAKIDLQGPLAPKLLARWAKEAVKELRFFRFTAGVQVEGMEVLVSRTGYTGEIGFELYTDAANAKDLWHCLLSGGKPLGILPCGLGARDTLRTEAGLPLHGHELRPDLPAVGHPWEFAMDWETGFTGKKALLEIKTREKYRHVVPFIMEGRRKAMHGWEVLEGGRLCGHVLSGVIAPSLQNAPIGFAELDRAAEDGAPLSFRQPGKDETLPGKAAAIPFVPLTSRKKMDLFL